MPTLLLLLLIPVLAAPLLAALQRWPAVVGGGGLLATLLLMALVPGTGNDATRVAAVDGIALVLRLGERSSALLLLLYALAAIIFFLSLWWPQGRGFTPALLASLSPLALVLMSAPSLLSLVALLAAVAVLAATIQIGRVDGTNAATRYLALTALALPPLILAGWMLASDQPIFLAAIWRLLLVAAAVLLAGFPFQLWVRPVVEAAPPLATLFTVTAGQLVVVTLFFSLLRQNPTLEQQTQLGELLSWSAALAAIFAGVLGLLERDARRLIGALLLGDMAAVLMAVSFGVDGLTPAVAALLLRYVSLLLALWGMHLLGQRASLGAWPALLFAYGALSLAGFPLTPGFAGRWAIVELAATRSSWLAATTLFSMFAGAMALLGWFAQQGAWPAIFKKRATSADANRAPSRPAAHLIGGVLFAGALLLTLFPQLLFSFALRLGNFL